MKNKKRNIIWGYILFLLFVFMGCVTTTPPPLPSSFDIASPSDDIPSELSAFLGVWEGKWGGMMETIIVVEKIDEDKATVIYSWGGKEAGYMYIDDSIIPGPTIEWRMDKLPSEDNVDCPCSITLKMNKDLNSIIGFASLEVYKVKLRAD
ncbi:MAG TPA: hypothetical protein ENH01_08395 [Nitrospirae bacterium]|nr:hypothetical protein [Nitrospirota bacterium]